MAHPRRVDPEALIEILEDVRHDLGKHLPLPLRLLPADADAEAVRAAARTALLRTRRSVDGATPAADLWSAFADELTAELGRPLREAGPAWVELAEAVERALAWRTGLDGELDRAALMTDLTAVARATDRVLDTLEPTDGPTEEIP